MTAHDRRSDVTAIPFRGGLRSTVPDLIGLSLEEACEAAAWAGIKLNATSAERHGRLGVVLAQSPPPGSAMESSRQVHVVVSAFGLPRGPAGA